MFDEFIDRNVGRKWHRLMDTKIDRQMDRDSVIKEDKKKVARKIYNIYFWLRFSLAIVHVINDKI